MSETFTVTVEPLGREVECREDQTILDACLRNGVWLPHSCTHGTCATCKVEVLDGDVDHGESSSFALMDFEREEGKTLVCCAFPQSDLTLEADVDVDEDVEVFPVEDYTGTVVAIDEVSTGTKRITLELDRDLSFNAGQYLRVMLPGSDVDRTYSMAQPPTETRTIELQVRLVEGGAATEGWIFKELSVGDEVRLAGPYGRFVLKPGGEAPAIMVAGGTGLAPIASMIKHALINGEYEGHITLYQGDRTADQIYDVDYFRALEQEYPDQFTYRPCLSQEEVEGFEHGRVTDVIEREHETLKGHQGYLCGSPAMVEGALKTLMSRRLFPRDIFREDFFNEADKANGGMKSPLIKR